MSELSRRSQYLINTPNTIYTYCLHKRSPVSGPQTCMPGESSNLKKRNMAEDAWPCSQLGDGALEDEEVPQQADDWGDGAESQPAGDAESACGPRASFVLVSGLHDSPQQFSLSVEHRAKEGVPGSFWWCRSAADRLAFRRAHKARCGCRLVPQPRLARIRQVQGCCIHSSCRRGYERLQSWAPIVPQRCCPASEVAANRAQDERFPRVWWQLGPAKSPSQEPPFH